MAFQALYEPAPFPGILVDSPKYRPGQGGHVRELCKRCSAKKTPTIIGLCHSPRFSASKTTAGGTSTCPGSSFVLIPIHLPSSLSLTREVPPSVGTAQSPLLTQAQEALTAQLALSSSSGRCYHGNSGKACSSEGSKEGRMERPCVDAATPSRRTETLEVAPADLLASPAL